MGEGVLSAPEQWAPEQGDRRTGVAYASVMKGLHTGFNSVLFTSGTLWDTGNVVRDTPSPRQIGCKKERAFSFSYKSSDSQI